MKRFSDFELDTQDWYKGVFEQTTAELARLVDLTSGPEYYRRMWHRCGWYATTRCLINRGYTKEQFRLIFPKTYRGLQT